MEKNNEKNDIDNTKKVPTETIAEGNMNNTEQNMDNKSNLIEVSTEPLQMKGDILTDLMMNLSNIVNSDSNVTYRIEKQAYMDQKEYILYADFTVKC